MDDHMKINHLIGNVIYVSSGALALVCSLWVIVFSSHLIALTRDASLRKNIVKASQLLDAALKQVHTGRYGGALTELPVGVTFGICLHLMPTQGRHCRVASG